MTQEVPKIGIAIGEGPAFLVLGMTEAPPAPGSVVHFKEEGVEATAGKYPVKALWGLLATSDSLLVRGRQLDGDGELLFQISEGDPIESSLVLPGGEGKWRYFPSAIYLGEAGCYGIQIDGLEAREEIVFVAEP